eukprot:TRINITY_DN504_c0_g1_i1.p1 TRINITY_DN504_c0_g1~~TRINITY_DN504_c0_g1_i1.p1  ORF type:complete len:458 (-),score=111.07 TRINITY_DN504_c0_g1_i1:202-1485(-)
MEVYYEEDQKQDGMLVEFMTEADTKKGVLFDGFINKQGYHIGTHKWLIPTPRAVVFLCHGFAEHAARYGHVAAALNKAGFSVYSHDHQGHGKSQGTRAYFSDFEHLADDAIHYVELCKREIPAGMPCFLLGHSMGGAVAVRVAQRRPDLWQGVVLSAPALMPDPKVAGAAVIAAVRFLSRLSPKARVDKLNAAHVSRDESVVKMYLEDPLIDTGGMRARVGKEILSTMKLIVKNMHLCTWPVLLVQGTEDKIVHPEGAKFFHRHAQSTDKTLKEYEGLYHEVFNEPEKETVIADVVSWLVAHLPDQHHIKTTHTSSASGAAAAAESAAASASGSGPSGPLAPLVEGLEILDAPDEDSGDDNPSAEPEIETTATPAPTPAVASSALPAGTLSPVVSPGMTRKLSRGPSAGGLLPPAPMIQPGFCAICV